MGSDENMLAAAMRTSASGLVPPTGLVKGGIARGRRMKLVRRLQVGASTAAVLAVAGTTLFTVSSGNEDGHRQVTGPASRMAEVPAPPTTMTPTARPTLAVPPGMVPVVPPTLLQTLLPLLPQGLVRSQITGSDNTDKTSAGIHSAGSSVSLVLEDSQGPTLVSLSVEQSASDSHEYSCPPQDGRTNARCTEVRTADGTRVLERQDWVYPASPDTPENRADGKAGPTGMGPKDWSVQVVRPNGVVIRVEEVASREEKGDIGRDTPILPLERLRSIALVPSWQVWVSPAINKAAEKATPTFTDRSPSSQKYETPPPVGASTSPITHSIPPPSGTWSQHRTESPSGSAIPSR
ncbi:hypothetical protein [Embleya sp. AB8]|uniref:hypothetical protein n=1 Tax=Embleya sp. AB8 TaxID=3156304 RepID=UPI003C76019C